MMKKILTAILLAATCLPLLAQDLYIATDKACYLAGESIGCSAFCRPGPAVAMVELVSAEGAAALAKLALKDGRGAGELFIPFSTPTGNYRLVSYLPGGKSVAGPVISVFNTLTTDRVKGGVEVVESGPLAPPLMETGYGLSVSLEADSLVISNLSGAAASVSVSLYREDSLQPAGRSSIAGFRLPAPSESSDGERISGRVTGPGAAYATGVILAVPGSKTDCYYAEVQEDGSFCAETENIFGDVDLVCIPTGLEDGQEAHVELDASFAGAKVSDIPGLQIFRGMEPDLLRRSASMKERLSADTLALSLPLRAGHFFLEHECISYELDDYTRFPTMEEVFVEIVPQVKLRHRSGRTHIYVLIPPSVTDGIPRWGDSVVMIDGVPVIDQGLVESYDPAIVKTVEVYPYKYRIGQAEFDGVVNLVTFDGRMPGLMLPDNIRIYGFHGCSLPRTFQGGETLFWHPLVDIPAGAAVAVPCDGAAGGNVYTLDVEGMTASGTPVYLRKTFLR